MYIKTLLCLLIFLANSLCTTFAQGTCKTKSNEAGICRLIDDCPVVIDTVRRKSYDYKICSHTPLLVCCPPSSKNVQNTGELTDMIEDRSSARKLHEIKCSEYTQYVYALNQAISLSVNSKRRKMDKCGNRDTPLIIGGEDAKPREFPHMALIGYHQNKHTVYKCGGTIISDEYILTAAHCLDTIFGPAKYVRLGELDLARDDEESDVKDFDVAERIAHPFYNSSLKYHDIALIRLNRKIDLDPFKRPACLPSSFESPLQKVIVTGWGKTKPSSPGSNILQRVILDKFNRTFCNEVYTQTEENKKILKIGIDEKTQLCAGSFTEDKDACQGDSGGPMQVYHHSAYCMYTVIGVTSFGILCGKKGVPGVYTRIYPYNDWIESIVWK